MNESVGVQVGKVCPSCGREASVPLLWGLPAPEAVKLAERGLVALGGCMVMHHDKPALVCRACGAHWGSDDGEDGDLHG